jgi:hypothetical protein
MLWDAYGKFMGVISSFFQEGTHINIYLFHDKN